MNPAFPILSQLNPVLWVLTVRAGIQRGGLVATFVHSASIVPDQPRMVVGIAKQHFSWKLIESAHRFVLHLISDRQLEWVRHFGLQSGRTGDKLSGHNLSPTPSGQVRLADALAWMDCRVESRMDTGDRTIYLAAVETGALVHLDPPLTAKRMVELAPPDMLEALRTQMERDIQVDEQAMRRWREHIQFDQV